MFTLSTIRSKDELVAALSEPLAALDNSNTHGEVMARIAPLLEALKPTVVLTGTTIDRLFPAEDDAPAKALVALSMAQRASPDTFAQAMLATTGLADLLTQAAAQGAWSLSWLASASVAVVGDSLAVEDARCRLGTSATVVTARSDSSMDVTFTLECSNHTVPQRLFFRTQDTTTISHVTGSGGGWQPIELSRISTRWIEVMVDYLGERLPTATGKNTVRGLLVATGPSSPTQELYHKVFALLRTELESRRAAANEILGDVLEKFERGELEGQVGRLDSTEISKIAAAVKGATASASN